MMLVLHVHATVNHGSKVSKQFLYLFATNYYKHRAEHFKQQQISHKQCAVGRVNDPD